MSLGIGGGMALGGSARRSRLGVAHQRHRWRRSLAAAQHRRRRRGHHRWRRHRRSRIGVSSTK